MLFVGSFGLTIFSLNIPQSDDNDHDYGIRFVIKDIVSRGLPVLK